MTAENITGTLCRINRMRGAEGTETVPSGFSAQPEEPPMLAAVATLVFLTTLWLVAFAGILMVGENRSKILAALRGQSLLAATPVAPRIALRVSQRARVQAPLRARPEWRAAA